MVLRVTFWIAAGVILGFMLGGVPVRRKVNALRAERDALQAKLAAADRPNLLQALLPAPTARPASDRSTAFARDPADADDPPVKSARPPVAEGAGGAGATAQARDERRHGDLPSLERFDQLVIAQRARIAAARSALIEQAGLDESQIALVDQSAEHMNAKLLGYGDEFIDQLASGRMPSALQMLGLGRDVGGILYDGQHELEAVVGKRSAGVDQSALEIWNYVDIGQWRSILEDKIQARGAAGAAAPPRR